MEANITQLDDRSIPPMDSHLEFMNHDHNDIDDNYNQESEQHHHQTQKKQKNYLPEFQEYFQRHAHQKQQQQPIYQMNSRTKDILTDLDKSAYVIIFLAFILGFFMGKTMQPVILRPM